MPVQRESPLIFGSFIFSAQADAWPSGDAAKEYSAVVTYCAAGLKSLKDRYTPTTRPASATGAGTAQREGSPGFKGADTVN